MTLQCESAKQSNTHCVGGYDDGPPSTAWRGPGALGSDKEYSEARRQPTEREAEAQNTY